MFLASERGKRTTSNLPTFTGQQVQERRAEIMSEIETYELAAQEADESLKDLSNQLHMLMQRKRAELRATERDEATIEGIQMDIGTLEGRISRSQSQWSSAVQGASNLAHVMADLEALDLIAETCLPR